MAISRILVPTDFSPASLQALDYAVEFAKPFKAELVVLFVVEPIYSIVPGDFYGPSPELGTLLDEQRRSGKEQLARLEGDLKKRRVKVRTILQTGTAAETIIDSAKAAKADMILMATHGRTGLSHLFMGSVAERVVRMAICPVLTVRTAAKRARTRRATTGKRTGTTRKVSRG